MCFFGHDAVFADPTSNLLPSGANDANNNAFSGNRLIQYDQATLKANFVANSAHPLYGYTGGSTIGFGIPTGAKIVDGNIGANSIPANAGSSVWNLYFASGADTTGNTGKDHPLTSEMGSLTSTLAREQRQMAYWGVLGASRNWWQSDIIAIQNQVLLSTATDKTSIITV
jgi:hypothetical protein